MSIRDRQLELIRLSLRFLNVISSTCIKNYSTINKLHKEKYILIIIISVVVIDGYIRLYKKVPQLARINNKLLHFLLTNVKD